jgi:hypothetical protein
MAAGHLEAVAVDHPSRLGVRRAGGEEQDRGEQARHGRPVSRSGGARRGVQAALATRKLRQLLQPDADLLAQ